MSNVLDLTRNKGIEPRKVAGTYGGEYHCPCPGCGGRDRFHVWPEQNNGEGSWWCRACGKAGDAIQFLIEFNGCTFSEACNALGKDLPTRGPYCEPHPPKKSNSPGLQPDPDPEAPSRKWQDKAQAFVSWAHDHLLSNPSKLKWLSARGIRKKTVERFRLGWNPGRDGKDLWRPRELWGLETITKNNGRKKRLWLPCGLLIPYFLKDELRRIRIRRPGKHEPRYYVIPGSAMDMMVFRAGSRAFVVIEAELDAMLIDQEAGDLCGTLALGSAGAKPHGRAIEQLRRAAVILLGLDYDSAGAKAVASWWHDYFPRAKRWPVPEGKDPGDAYKLGLDIAAWVRSGLPPGWRLGPSLEKSDRKGERKTQAPAVEAPPAVVELAQLLKAHPVSIRITGQRTHLRHTQKWARENWDAAKRISELVFMTEGVMDYLERQDDEIITGENIL